MWIYKYLNLNTNEGSQNSQAYEPGSEPNIRVLITLCMHLEIRYNKCN